MNYMKALLGSRNRPLMSVPFKYFSTPEGAVFSHLCDESSFVLKLPKGHAEVNYDKENGVLNLYETTVPENYQGQGIGKLIAKNVFDYCLERNIKVKLNCTFLIKFSEQNPKYNKIIIPSD